MRKTLRAAGALLLLAPWLALAAPAAKPPAAPDPLDSARWEDMRRQLFADAPVAFDARIKVSAPSMAENPLNVPITVDATALARDVPGSVREILVFADFNPIVQILRFYPGQATPFLGFRVKLQQSTPLRAAVRGDDGVWRVGGAWVNTTGGGCTAPSVGSASPEWQRRLGEVSGRLFARATDGGQGQERVRLRIVHPMDTGLVGGIPAFFIQELVLRDGQGRDLMRIEPNEPVSENPVFTVDLAGNDTRRIQVSGRDNNGNLIQAWLE